MSANFDEIPSVIEIPIEPPPKLTVAQELEAAKDLLLQRKTQCASIKPHYQNPKRLPLIFGYKFFCICPHYNPQYGACKHSGNVIIDRDVLSKEEHICYLSTPRKDLAAPRRRPRYQQKKIIMPNCTTRIEQLAMPDIKRVRWTLDVYKEKLRKRQINTLKSYLGQQTKVRPYSIRTALSYIDEEKRLRKVSTIMRKRQCRKLRKHILRKQRKQIKKIICVLFEEMREFLLNDQFLIDERSTLCAVILEQIRNFTDNEFYTTSNVREYQQILANNLTVWINKFISNLGIHLAPPPENVETLEPDTFLPVKDYICSETLDDNDDEFKTEPSDYYLDEEDNEFTNYTEDTAATITNIIANTNR